MRREREGKIRDNREKEKTWRKEIQCFMCMHVCVFVILSVLC